MRSGGFRIANKETLFWYDFLTNAKMFLSENSFNLRFIVPNTEIIIPRRRGCKPARAHRVIRLYPPGVLPRRCKLRYEQFVWRFLGHRAQHIHYKIYAVPGSGNVPKVPGVRNRRCEYGIKFLFMLAHHVYW
ncbi:MAG: hypothetical protein LBU34_02450 [Planctomycetaceae bacterium]|nr:hypothetical protein [Planctomycetaceae bacterium]